MGKIKPQYLHHSNNFHDIRFQTESTLSSPLLSSTKIENKIKQGNDDYFFNLQRFFFTLHQFDSPY